MALADAPPRPATLTPTTPTTPLPRSHAPGADTGHILGPMRGATDRDETVFLVSVSVGTVLYRVRVAFPATAPRDEPADRGGGQADVGVDPLPLPALGHATDDGAHAGIVAVFEAAQAALQRRYEQERASARHPGWVRLWHDAATRLARYQQDYLALARAADSTA